MSVVLRGVVDPTSSTDPGAPLLVLGPSLGTGVAAWSEAASRLVTAFRVLRVDLPGHGLSPAARAPFSFADLADAVVALVDGVGGGRFVYAGVSIGGAIGVELATGVHRDRLAGLAVICSGARIGQPEGWAARAAQVRAQGTPALVAPSSARWFAPSFPSREPDLVGRTLTELMDADDESYALLAEALGAFDRRADLDAVAAPTLVVVGDSDPVVTVEDAAATAAALPGALQPVVLAETGHQAHLERPAELAALLIERFAPRSRYDTGMAVRREVLGAEWVDRANAGVTPETADFQRFITETAWGSIWSRPGLDRRTRRAITIASMVTAHHWEELAMHLRAALADGMDRDELVEVLLQMAVYAGVPAANSAFRVAKQVFAESDERPAGAQPADEQQ